MTIRYGTETWAVCKLISAQKHTNNIEAVRILHAAITSVRLGPWGKPVKAEVGWMATCLTPVLPEFERFAVADAFRTFLNQYVQENKASEQSPIKIGNVEFWMDETNNLCFDLPSSRWNTQEIGRQLADVLQAR